MSNEKRVVNKKTGGEKGTKDQTMELLPPIPLMRIAEIYCFGKNKYAANNWRKGYDWSLSYGAMQRHLNLWWDGEELDEESGLSHLGHAAFHILALMEFNEFPELYKELDDRFVR